ncbi:uncharacterized protein LOC113004747 [Solenopsis invicta]|uniref:uncharacterized protein LOC113004747 n=1 Tax=Solenopsis invicta TaxID=13686 RepID=UPI000E33DBF3|nr:uncharacterized protein LOC113004747 [Solenopsis invicta]
MKTLVFVACILSAVSADNILDHQISNIFNITELLDYLATLKQCALKLGLSEIVTPETSFCLSQNKNLIDEKNGIKMNESKIYVKKIIRDSNLQDEMVKIFEQCQEPKKRKSDKFKRSGYDETIKFLKCILPFVNYVLKGVPFYNSII